MRRTNCFPVGNPLRQNMENVTGEKNVLSDAFVSTACLFHMYLETVPSFREPIGKIVSELFLSLLVCFDCSHLIVMTIQYVYNPLFLDSNIDLVQNLYLTLPLLDKQLQARYFTKLFFPIFKMGIMSSTFQDNLCKSKMHQIFNNC